MRSRLYIMLPAAIGFGLVAIKAGRQWIDRQVEERIRSASENAPAAAVRPASALATIVVATARLKFGAELTPDVLREIPWPAGSMPRGAFSHVVELRDQEGKRFALSTIEEGEAILESRITGPGQRAQLAAVLEEGKKAVTVRVDDVAGVAGFILPGDRVDVLLMRTQDKGGATSDVLLQNLKVLAIDQLIDDRSSKPSIAHTVTFEVSIEEAQRLAVAQNVGGLTLALRPVGEEKAERTKRVTVADLLTGASGRDAEFPTSGVNPNITVGVTRGAERKEYAVPLGRTR